MIGLIEKDPLKDKELSLAIFVCRGTVIRPTKEDYGNFVVMQEAVINLSSDNVCFVFTQCDMNPGLTNQELNSCLRLAQRNRTLSMTFPSQESSFLKEVDKIKLLKKKLNPGS